MLSVCGGWQCRAQCVYTDTPHSGHSTAVSRRIFSRVRASYARVLPKAPKQHPLGCACSRRLEPLESNQRRGVFVWGFGVLFLSCVRVSVSGVLFSVGVCESIVKRLWGVFV